LNTEGVMPLTRLAEQSINNGIPFGLRKGP
jgi:hypothetical protein